MDDMEWAKWGLDYLYEARAKIHGDFNEIRKQFKGMPSSLIRESWFKSSRDICAHLYHFSSEFVEDRTIPGSKFASPQAFKEELAGYHAFVMGMRDQLVDEDEKYKKSKEEKETQWLISESFRPVLYLLAAIEYVQSKLPQTVEETPEVCDIRIIEMMARRFHECVLSLAKHPRSKPTLAIHDEWDCQYLFGSILASYFPDVRVEEWVHSVGGSSARCEFFLKTLRTMVELKFVRSSSDQKKTKEELATDFLNYGNDPLVDHLVCLVYDPQQVLKNPVGFQSDLSGPRTGLASINVIVSPPRDA